MSQKAVVVGRGSLLILDEPTRGVDVHAKAQILTILDRLATEGVGIIFISSELEEVVAVSHRILTMSRGRIVGEMEIIRRPCKKSFYRQQGSDAWQLLLALRWKVRKRHRYESSYAQNGLFVGRLRRHVRVFEPRRTKFFN